MEQRTRGKRRRRKNWKRIIIAYALRTLVAVVLMGMVFLMICGCIFLYQLGHRDKDKDTSSVVNGHVETQLGGSGTKPENPLPLSDCKIVLDAGHGGDDGGCNYGDIVEKDVALAVTQALGGYLEAQGIQVVYTRREDTSLSLSERAKLVNEETPDLLVSIHCNSYEEDPSVRGLEIHYQKNRQESKSMAEQISGWLEKNSSIATRAAKENNLQVLRETSVNSMLIELGFLTNTEDRKMLSSPERQEALAKVLADGILQYIQE